MTEEKQECKCMLQCECFKKFLVVMMGSFIGVFFALSLFAAVNKPCPAMPKHFGAPYYGVDFVKIEEPAPPIEGQKPPVKKDIKK